MKIYYDHQIFSFKRYGGIARYYVELMREFRRYQDVETMMPLWFSNNYYLADRQFTDHIDFLPGFEGGLKDHLFLYLNKKNFKRKTKKRDFDIFHPTYYDPFFLKHIGNTPFVLTVHDMIHEKIIDGGSGTSTTSRNKKALIEKAGKIIAISRNTKKDLIELFGIAPSRIEVIYHGNSMTPDLDPGADIDIPDNYILYVGSRVGYKNFTGFVKAVSKILSKDRTLNVICAGGGAFRKNELSLFSDLSIRDQIFQYNLNDKTLAHLYNRARLFVFPSLYEGFGIPILEAFSCGCPLVCSNTSSFPEVAVDGAFYFDPHDIPSMENAIRTVLHDNGLRKELAANGKKRLKEFSWEKAAAATKKVYESVL